MKNYLKAFLAMGAFLFASVVFADTVDNPVINEEDFEDVATGSLTGVKVWTTDEKGNITHQGIWESEEKDDLGSMNELAVVTAYENTTDPSKSVTPPKDEKGNSIGGQNYLALETTKPLYRNVLTAGDEPYAISSGLYFEGDVQFSPYEDDVNLTKDVASDSKLLVYLKSTDTSEDASTETTTLNFKVVAGYYEEGDVLKERKIYECDLPTADFDKDAFHHLIIKTYRENNCTYFKILVDGVALTCADYKGDEKTTVRDYTSEKFPSMITSGDNKSTLSGIGFKGTGKVDNLVWTTKDPDPEMKQYKFVWTDGQGTPTVTTNTFSIGEVENGKVYKFADGIDVAWKFEPKGGYAVENESPKGVVDGNLITVTFVTSPAVVQLVYTSGEETKTNSFADFAAAFAKANELEGVTTTIKLLTDASIKEESTDGGVEFSYETVLILNGYTLTVNGAGLYGNGMTIWGKENEAGSTEGTIIATAICDYSLLTINGGKFSCEAAPYYTVEDEPTKAVVPSGYTLTQKDNYWQLDAGGGSTDPEAEDGTIETDPDTGAVTITAVTTDDGSITLKNVSDCEINIPSDVKVTSIKGTVNDVSKIHIKYTNAETSSTVDITGAFSVTTKDNVTTIELDATRSVTFTNEDGNEVTVSVTPELGTTDDTEPFAVGDSVSATVKAIPGLTYQLLGSDTVKAPADFDTTTPVAEETADTSGTVTLTDTSDKGDAKFYTIRVTREKKQ